MSPSVLGLIAGDQTSWECEPLAQLAAKGELMAFEHTGFWQPMDTLREKNLLQELWANGKAPWKFGNDKRSFGLQILARQACPAYRPYRIQRRVACAMASPLGCACYWYKFAANNFAKFV